MSHPKAYCHRFYSHNVFPKLKNPICRSVAAQQPGIMPAAGGRARGKTFLEFFTVGDRKLIQPVGLSFEGEIKPDRLSSLSFQVVLRLLA